VSLLQWLLFAALPAAVVVLLGVGVGGPRWLAPSLAGAAIVPAVIARGVPWPPFDAGAPHGVAVWVLLASGVVGGLVDARWLWRPIALAVSGALLALLVWLVSAPMRAAAGFEGALLVVGGGAVLTSGVWFGLRAAATSPVGFLFPVAAFGLFTADALVCHRLGATAGGDAASTMAVAVAAAAVLGSSRRSLRCGRGAALPLAVAHVLALAAGTGLGAWQRAPRLLLLAAPAALLLAARGPAVRRPVAAAWLALAAASLVAAGAWLLA
jgi:hypothetical protein